MPPIRVEIDGHEPMEFPEGTDQNAIDMVVKRDVIGNTPPTQPAPAKDIPLASVPLEAIKNIPSSTGSLLKNISQAVLHPLDTGHNLGQIAEGGLNAIGLGPKNQRQESTQKWEAFKKALAERYGGYENIKRTVAADPVGSLSDVSALFTGGGSLVSKVPQLAKTGSSLSKIGSTIEPLSLMGQAIKPAVNVGGKILAGSTGFTTGAGADSVRQAYKAGKENIPEFQQIMRENPPIETIRDTANSSLQAIKNDRATDYQTRLSSISNNVQDLNINPVRTRLAQLEKMYNIKRTPDGLDFSRSTLDKNSLGDIENVINTVDDWGKQQGDLTPVGMDILKRKLDDFYSESKNSRGFVTSLKNEVKNTIVNQVPEYKTMLGNYEKSSAQINEIEKALSLGKRASIDTGIRKLMTALKDNNDFRGSLVKILDDANGGQLATKLAAYNLKSWTPQSLMGKAIDVTAIGTMMYAVSPKLAIAFATASPRVVGEFAYRLGQAARQQERIKRIFPAGVRQTATQTGRYTQPQMTEE